MKGITKEEKKKFLREIDVWNFRINKLYTEFNRVSNDLNLKNEEFGKEDDKLKEADKNYQEVLNETKQLKSDKKNLIEAVSSGKKRMSELFQEEKDQLEVLNKLKTEIDDQIAENKTKEEEALREVKAEIKNEQGGLSTLHESVEKKQEENGNLLKESEALKDESKIEKIELDKSRKERKDNGEFIQSQIGILRGREATVSKRDKQQDFYGKRLQRWAKKLSVQLKKT